MRAVVSVCVAALLISAVALVFVAVRDGDVLIPNAYSQTSSTKVNNFIKTVLAATTFQAAHDAAKRITFTSAELGMLATVYNDPTSAFRKKLDQLYSAYLASPEYQALWQPLETASVAKLDSLKLAYSNSLKAKGLQVTNALAAISTTCSATTPSINSVVGQPIVPGVAFGVVGNGFGSGSGTVKVLIAGTQYPATVISWGNCKVGAYLSNTMSGLKASNSATLILTTTKTQTSTATVNFAPLLEIRTLTGHDSCDGMFDGCSENRTYHDYPLKNDWYVKAQILSEACDGHAEFISKPAWNVPNVLAKTVIHMGCSANDVVCWKLWTYIEGPKGLAYK